MKLNFGDIEYEIIEGVFEDCSSTDAVESFIDDSLKVMNVVDGIAMYKHSKGDAGFDLYSTKDTWIFPFRTTKVELNIRCKIPEGYFGLVTSRSGESLKGNFVVPGIIDSNYIGIISAIVTRIGLFPKKIKKGTRIAQMILIPFNDPNILLASKLESTNRGDKGFGSSGNQ